MNSIALHTVRTLGSSELSEPQPIAAVMSELLARYGVSQASLQSEWTADDFASDLAQPVAELAFA